MFFHRHRWKVTGVDQMFAINRYLRDVQKPVTQVLLVCDCGYPRTICLDGHWTLEQLQPAPSEKQVDREFLRKMGVKL